MTVTSDYIATRKTVIFSPKIQNCMRKWLPNVMLSQINESISLWKILIFVSYCKLKGALLSSIELFLTDGASQIQLIW